MADREQQGQGQEQGEGAGSQRPPLRLSSAAAGDHRHLAFVGVFMSEGDKQRKGINSFNKLSI